MSLTVRLSIFRSWAQSDDAILWDGRLACPFPASSILELKHSALAHIDLLLGVEVILRLQVRLAS